jgi:YD repeat-containing protein
MESYTYGSVGNRLTSAAGSYAYNASNEMTSSTTATFTYDNNGNTTSKTDSTGTTNYTWDFENRLSSITLPGNGGTMQFKYDPAGRRIYKSSSAGTYSLSPLQPFPSAGIPIRASSACFAASFVPT